MMMSSDNIVAVVFASDFRVNGAGFNLTFAAIDGELLSASHTVSDMLISTLLMLTNTSYLRAHHDCTNIR